jgi:hypothetical protein
MSVLLAWSNPATFSVLPTDEMRQISGLNPAVLEKGTQTCADVNTGANIVTQATCLGLANPPAGTSCVKCADVQTTYVTGGNGAALFKGNGYVCSGAREYASCVAGGNGMGACVFWVPNGNCVNQFTVYTLQ